MQYALLFVPRSSFIIYHSILMLTFPILLIAALYSSVGFGGGLGYLALMSLFNIDPAVMKPTALVLNILVTTIGTYKYSRSGHFSWTLFLPFAMTSIPFAFLGGRLNLDGDIYKGIVGVLLLYAALRIFFTARVADNKPISAPLLWISLLGGAMIGFISGITGVGGGIFLSPLVLLMGWATPKETAGVSNCLRFGQFNLRAVWALEQHPHPTASNHLLGYCRYYWRLDWRKVWQ